MITLKTGFKRGLNSLLAGLFLYLVGCQTVPEAPVTPVEEPVPLEVEDPVDEEIDSAEVEPEASVEQVPVAVGELSLEAVVRDLGATLEPGLESSQWIIHKGEDILKIVEGSRKVYWNDLLVFLNKPIVFEETHLVVDEADVRTLFKPAFSDLAFVPRSGLIVIDPGHGGSEDGAKNEDLGLIEKELTLDVSKRLQTHLEALGYQILLTRYDDRLLPLVDRSEIANRENAALFISIHFNASVNETAQGLETYILTPEGHASTADSEAGSDNEFWPGNRFDATSARFAYEIQQDMLETLQREDRGLKKARFAVLKRLDCPGVLVECGFVSHKDESLLVRTPVYREKLALSLSRSIDAFYGGLEPKSDEAAESSEDDL